MRPSDRCARIVVSSSDPESAFSLSAARAATVRLASRLSQSHAVGRPRWFAPWPAHPPPPRGPRTAPRSRRPNLVPARPGAFGQWFQPLHDPGWHFGAGWSLGLAQCADWAFTRCSCSRAISRSACAFVDGGLGRLADSGLVAPRVNAETATALCESPRTPRAKDIPVRRPSTLARISTVAAASVRATSSTMIGTSRRSAGSTTTATAAGRRAAAPGWSRRPAAPRVLGVQYR